MRSKVGQRLEFTYSTPSGNAAYTADEEIIQANMQTIGIKLNLHNYPFNTLISVMFDAKPGKYDFAEFPNTYNYDPDDAQLLACDQIPPNGFNVSFYCNPALDKLLIQEQSTTDPAARQQTFNQIHQIFLTDFPFLVLYGSDYIALVKNTTHNYLPGPFGAFEAVNIWEWWCDGGHC